MTMTTTKRVVSCSARRSASVLFALLLCLHRSVVWRQADAFASPKQQFSWNNKARRTRRRLYAGKGVESSANKECDVLVLGSGPAGRAIASLLAGNGGGGSSSSSSSSRRLKVILADQNLDRSFPPNYGVWHDEWDAILDRYKFMGVKLQGGNQEDCIDRKWDFTDCYFGGSFNIPMKERLRLDRPYYRVDRDALRDSLTSHGNYDQLKANHVSTAIAPNVYEPANSLVHDRKGTSIELQERDGGRVTVRTKLVVDCTGHETKLVLREARDPSNSPGFQIAYGFLVDTDETPSSNTDPSQIGPYDKEAMTLFDYRTDHYDDTDEGTQMKVERGPTFMYAMPLKDNQIFFEETSLVARPALSFQECKDRCMKRLEYHGIKVTKLHEEEFCYIPMGGALPAKDQRVLALGGAAAMVHPSTGYHLCRCLVGASDMAKVIMDGLAEESPNLDKIAADSYHALWSPSNIRQRDFAVFGGEFLMKQDVVGLRGFFDGFFRLPLPLWAGFLAGWPGLPNNESHETWLARMWFGINFVVRLPPPVALDMLGSIVSYIAFENLALARSVTPFLGEPESYKYKENKDKVGDVAAKAEARRMIQESKLAMDLPVDFEAATTSKKSQNSAVEPMPRVAESVKVQESFQ